MYKYVGMFVVLFMALSFPVIAGGHYGSDHKMDEKKKEELKKKVEKKKDEIKKKVEHKKQEMKKEHNKM